MNYFTAVKVAPFAESLFQNAGLDLHALFAAGNPNALKSAIEAKAQPTAEIESALAAAVEENNHITTKVADLSNQLAAAVAYKADAEKYAALSAAVVAAGLDATKPEGLSAELDAKLKARATNEAVSIVARAGHPGVEEPIAEGVKLKSVAAIDPSLTGIERTIAAMKASAAAKK